MHRQIAEALLSTRPRRRPRARTCPERSRRIARAHQFWRKRLPALFAAERIRAIEPANPLLEQLRPHNRPKHRREIGMTPQAAWNLAKKKQRFVLRPAPRCPWWPYVFSVRTVVSVGSDGRIAVGPQRLRITGPPGSKVVRCQHPNGDLTVLRTGPAHGKRPEVLLHCLAGRSSAGLNTPPKTVQNCVDKMYGGALNSPKW